MNGARTQPVLPSNAKDEEGAGDFAGLFSGMSLNGNNLAFHHQHAAHIPQPMFDTATGGFGDGPVLTMQPQAYLPAHPHAVASGVYGTGSHGGSVHGHHHGHGAQHTSFIHGDLLGMNTMQQGGHQGFGSASHQGHQGHQDSQVHMSHAGGEAEISRGWGGQMLASDQSALHSRYWMGKGRGGGQNMAVSGRRGRYRGGGRGGGRGTYGRVNEVSGNVDLCVRILCDMRDDQRIENDVFSMVIAMDSRALSKLLKELSRMGMSARAVELFDGIRASNNPSLLDVFTYTAAISLCIATHDVERALGLVEEMRLKKIHCNVHTYTALMNVCIKCSRYGTALDTYETMRREGCVPNVVTFNTLIDVYGKTGAWEQASRVLDVMRTEGIDPVLRTYNTLLIACNMCNQPREAIMAYKRMLSDGFAPNSTTYNALISAYGKSGQLEKVMEVFHEMSSMGCEKNVITYSSLISACEKAGQWELALELFQEMGHEQCNPNTVTFNSLITALGQGGQWEKAKAVFDQMKSRNCTPDVVTYTALISAMEKGGQWRLAIKAFEQMMVQRCKPDAIVYNAIINALWETGIIWAQRHALRLFHTALANGHFPQQSLIPGLVRAEVNLHATTSGVAMLSLYVWLIKLRQFVEDNGVEAVPAKVTIVTDRGRSAREQGNSIIKESVNHIMSFWKSPFVLREQRYYSGSLSLEATGDELAAWVMSPQFVDNIFAFFPCSDIMQSAEKELELQELTANGGDMELEAQTEKSCSVAFAAVRHFEQTHCLAVQNMGCEYLQRRAALTDNCVRINRNLGSPEEVAHDATLLMDRVMSTNLTFASEVLDLLAASCVSIAYDHSEKESEKDFEVFERASGLPAWAIKQMEWSIRQILNHDTQSISSIRCIKLLNERLGVDQLGPACARAFIGNEHDLCLDCVAESSFLNCRPSIVASAVVYVSRRARGAIPFWPSSLSRLTGYSDIGAPEISIAIKAAQRIASRNQYSGEGDIDVHGATNTVAAINSRAGLSDALGKSASPGDIARTGSVVKEDALNSDTEAILNSIYELVSNSQFPITPEETECSAPNGSTERSTSNEGGSGSSNNGDGSNNDDGSNESQGRSENVSNDGASERESDD